MVTGCYITCTDNIYSSCTNIMSDDLFHRVQESLPFEYAKIFAFDSFARTQKSVFSKVKEIDSSTQEGCFSTGCFVRLHILHVPASKVESILKSYKTNPVVVCGLLQHESKMSVLHFRYWFTHLFASSTLSDWVLCSFWYRCWMHRSASCVFSFHLSEVVHTKNHYFSLSYL